jgi:lipopolysaccharide biosynthesis regulator YciM
VAVATEARGDPRHEALVRSAAQDCVRAYARVGRPERARDFFRRVDPARAELLVQHLVEIYEQEGRPQDAARVRGP